MGQDENGIKGQLKTAHWVNVRRFFHQVLNRLKEGLFNELDETTISILQTPQHLNLFCKVYKGNKRKKEIHFYHRLI